MSQPTDTPTDTTTLEAEAATTSPASGKPVNAQDVLLQTRAMDAYYGDFQALYGVDFHLNRGEAVAIIGANGAGKTTFLRAICGLLPSPAEAVTFDGQAIGNMEAYRIVQAGIAMVPEGRRLFPSLSVEENLLVGAHTQRKGPWSLDAIYSLFPILGERRHQPGTQLSGGQQQMVAIGRALMSNPTLLLCDELSLGLAPIIVREIYQMLPRVREQGTSVLVVEQDIRQALDAADRVYCFQEGRVSLEGAPNTLTREQITQAYFGV